METLGKFNIEPMEKNTKATFTENITPNTVKLYGYVTCMR